MTLYRDAWCDREAGSLLSNAINLPFGCGTVQAINMGMGIVFLGFRVYQITGYLLDVSKIDG